MSTAPATGLLADVLAGLDARPEGLSAAAAAARLAAHGANQLRGRSTRARLLGLVRGAVNPLVLLLLVASIASAALGQIADATIIAGIVVLSGGINTWQTTRSERAVARLQAQVAPLATALRDGAWCEVPRRTIVVGDVVRLAAGDLVPADVRLLTATDLHVQQSALTGESLPVEKEAAAGALPASGPDAAALLFLGTSVVSGTATAVVLATGADTAFGDIVVRLSARPIETEFDRGMRRFGMLILQVVVFLVVFVLVINIALGRDALQSVLFSVALAVGLTPEFLPMITTVTLAQGAVRMAREKVIVKHLSAIQNLGSIDVLCCDKTGTLTAGTMTVDASLDPLGAPAPRALALAHVNSAFESGIQSPLDAAILAQAGPAPEGYRKTDEVPFDFERRRLSVVAERGAGFLLVTKGAPESVLAVCTTYELGGAVAPLDAAARARCTDAFAALGRQGMRVLAVAWRAVPRGDGFHAADERDLTLAGFVTFADHLRPGVREALSSLERDGVHVKIVTGDNELVTTFICAQAGLSVERVVLGADLENLDEPALAHVAEQASVFARVSPAQKHRIIAALRASGHAVGFLGDGINDAPSLHGADVGISVAGAVDVAREASDIILLEPGLEVLHAGILAGRRSFGNVLKYLLMGTSSNFGNMFSMLGAALLLPFLPMLPTQILLNNFLYDLAQITIPTDTVDPVHLRTPQRWDIGVIRRFMILMGPISSLYDFATFGALLWWFHASETAFHTGWFLESLATQTLVLFVIRTAGRPWSNRPSWPLTVTTVLVVLLGFLLPVSPFAGALGLTPLPPRFFLFVSVLVASYLSVVEVVKRRVWR